MSGRKLIGFRRFDKVGFEAVRRILSFRVSSNRDVVFSCSTTSMPSITLPKTVSLASVSTKIFGVRKIANSEAPFVRSEASITTEPRKVVSSIRTCRFVFDLVPSRPLTAGRQQRHSEPGSCDRPGERSCHRKSLIEPDSRSFPTVYRAPDFQIVRSRFFRRTYPIRRAAAVDLPLLPVVELLFLSSSGVGDQAGC